MFNQTCSDCGPIQRNHWAKYAESFFEHALPKLPDFFINLGDKLEKALERFLILAKILKRIENFLPDEIPKRGAVFAKALRQKGVKLWVLKGPFGYTNRFQMEFGGRLYSFEGLPRAEFLEDSRSRLIDDKAAVKSIFSANAIPTPSGRCFNLLQKKRAVEYGLTLGFPLVVKPRSGSAGQHVILNISSRAELENAMRRAFIYEPFVIIERYLPDAKSFRATVIDFERVFVVERVPAHVMGDSIHRVQELIDIKNNEPRRSSIENKNAVLYKLVIDEVSKVLLKKQRFDLLSIPSAGQKVFLQEKVVRDLGSDFIELTPLAHPENLELFIQIAKLFNVRLVGIDFIAESIERSWKGQKSAIVELNSLPFIDMHHFPNEGQPQNPAAKLVNLVEKYY